MKLANPDQELSTTQSSSLANHCAQLEEQNAASTLQINLAELKSLFTQCKEKQAEEQRNTNQ